MTIDPVFNVSRRPEFEPMEEERESFEIWVQFMWPERSLERWGDTYKDCKVRDRWIGWQGHARGCK